MIRRFEPQRPGESDEAFKKRVAEHEKLIASDGASLQRVRERIDKLIGRR